MGWDDIRTGGWDEFENRTRKPEPKPDEFAELCALVLTTANGKRLVEMFRAMTIDRALGSAADDRALLALEAQRLLVRRIEGAIARGLEQAKPKG